MIVKTCVLGIASVLARRKINIEYVQAPNWEGTMPKDFGKGYELI